MSVSVRMKSLGWRLLVPLLCVSSLAAASPDLRLVDAVRNQDRGAARSLLAQHVDVNAREADGATALEWAVYRNDAEMAELLIRAGARVNVANDLGVTPLALACANGGGAMIDALLKAGADPNAARPSGETPLMAASRTGSVEGAKSLLAHGARVNAKENVRDQTALMWAVAEGHPEVAGVLIEHGADVHARSKSGFTPLMFAAQRGDLDSARLLLAAGAEVNEATPHDGSALVVASASGREDLAIFLLDHGADPNLVDARGIAPLHYTMIRGISLLDNVWYEPFRDAPGLHYTFWPFRPNLDRLAKALLAHGANPNARITKDPVFPTSYKTAITSPIGATPFMLAAATYDVDLMRALAAKGADPKLAAKDRTTPLIMAAGLGERLCGLDLSVGRPTEGDDKARLEAVKLAVELGSDVNAANESGLTALHAAAFLGSDAVIKLLVEHGAAVDAKDKYGQTALSIAEKDILPGLMDLVKPQEAHKSTADLLRQLGARPVAPQNAQLTQVTP